MQRSTRNLGLMLGLLVTVPLTGCLYLASQVSGVSFLPLNLADIVIRLTPGAIATAGIENLGFLAKLSLEIASVITFQVLGGLLGWLGIWWLQRQRLPSLIGAGALFGLLVYACLLTLHRQWAIMIAPGDLRAREPLVQFILLGLSIAWGAGLGWLYRGLKPQPQPQPPVSAEVEFPYTRSQALDRRAFLQRSTTAAVMLTFGSTALAELMRRSSEAYTRVGAATASAPELLTRPDGFLIAPGTRPHHTTMDRLYTIAISTREPEVDVTTFGLRIDGAVDAPLSLSLDQLRSRPRINQTSTLQCISNEIGGPLVGNVNWNGTPLSTILEEAKIQNGAARVVFHGAEGYVDSIPLDIAFLPTTLVVYGIDEQPLTRSHGFPVRIIVPTIYGMKNVKWLQRIEVIKTDFEGYWQQRGWSNSAFVKTTSVLDTSGPLKVENGKVALGGIAFAGDRGIQGVEVQINDEPWQPALLESETTKIQWRFWRYDWATTPGTYTIKVRALDGAGVAQSAEITNTHPDGASGYHQLRVKVIA